MSGQLTMYTTPWCGFCRNLKRQLARDGIEMVEVDIEQDESAAEYVRTAPWLVIFPGVAISFVVFGTNLLGDALRDLLDPRQRS